MIAIHWILLWVLETLWHFELQTSHSWGKLSYMMEKSQRRVQVVWFVCCTILPVTLQQIQDTIHIWKQFISQLFGPIFKRIVGVGLNFLISWYWFGSQCQNQKLVVQIQLRRLSASTVTKWIVDFARFMLHVRTIYCWGALTVRNL